VNNATAGEQARAIAGWKPLPEQPRRAINPDAQGLHENGLELSQSVNHIATSVSNYLITLELWKCGMWKLDETELELSRSMGRIAITSVSEALL
jgi:hypothetical protein